MSKEQKTILLVDDNAIVAMDDSMNLKEYGYNVIHVMTGQKAIDTVSTRKSVIDLILMDINLGEEKDGTEIAKIILKENDIPILFHSSHTEREIVERTENITSFGYVVKNGITVLDASIKMAFRLHDAYQKLKNQTTKFESSRGYLQVLEKRYRRLFEAARDGILILNADNGMIVDVNPFLINLLGYSKEQFLQKFLWDISAFKNIDYSKKLYKELQEKQYVRYEDIPLVTSGGKSIHVEFVSNLYLVDNDKVIQCNIRDITDRKNRDKILKDNVNENKALLKEPQHRTKNSFSIITSLIRFRASATHSEETKKTLEELNYRVKAISDLYSLLNETDSIYEVSIKTYFTKIIESMQSIAKNIVINRQIEEIIFPTKNAATLGMILVELLSNSIKYAFPDSYKGTINIELKTENSQIVFILEDDGVGLPKDFDIIKIKSLGLHLTDLMAHQLQGKMEFVSGKGTKIIIKFPLDK